MKKSFISAVLLIMVMSTDAKNGLRLEERLSLWFHEISLTNETTLVVRLREDGISRLEIASEKGDNSYCEAERGQILFRNQGDVFSFRPRGVRQNWRLTVLDQNGFKRLKTDVPSVFLCERTLVFLEHGESQFVISPSAQKIYSSTERSIRDFKFPFRSLWANAEDEAHWFNMRQERELSAWVLSSAMRIQEKAEKFYGVLPIVDDIQFLEVELTEKGRKKGKILVTEAMRQGVFKSAKSIKLVVEESGKKRYVVGVLIAGEDAKGGGLTYFFKFDRDGHLRCACTFVPPPVLMGKSNVKKLLNAVEYDAKGRVLRAKVTHGEVGSVWIATEQGLVMVRDSADIQRFYSDISIEFKNMFK